MIGPSTKIPRPRSATAMSPASTPVGTMSAGPRKLPAFATLPERFYQNRGLVEQLAGNTCGHDLGGVKASRLKDTLEGVMLRKQSWFLRAATCGDAPSVRAGSQFRSTVLGRRALSRFDGNLSEF